MKISVIIPTYNEEKVITDCLESLGKQTYQDFEIIVVDDGSTDNSKQMLSKITPLPGLKVIEASHKGAGAARNLGAKKATGKILVFVDADMTFEKNFLKKLVEPIKKGKVIGTFSREEYLANKDKIRAVSWNINRGLPKDRMHPKNYPDSDKVFRAILKKDFDKVGGFNEKAGYTDDWSLSEKLGVMAQAAPGAVFYHKNPETPWEVFTQSRWMAKRKYKFGVLGYLIALFRVSLPVSLIVGGYKAITHAFPFFILFKIVSDFGQFIGIIEYALGNKVSK